MAEVLPIMASALGPQTYGPVFQQLVFQPLIKRFQAGQPDGVRSTMIGRPLSLLAVQYGVAVLSKILTQVLACLPAWVPSSNLCLTSRMIQPMVLPWNSLCCRHTSHLKCCYLPVIQSCALASVGHCYFVAVCYTTLYLCAT